MIKGIWNFDTGTVTGGVKQLQGVQAEGENNMDSLSEGILVRFDPICIPQSKFWSAIYMYAVSVAITMKWFLDGSYLSTRHNAP